MEKAKLFSIKQAVDDELKYEIGELLFMEMDVDRIEYSNDDNSLCFTKLSGEKYKLTIRKIA